MDVGRSTRVHRASLLSFSVEMERKKRPTRGLQRSPSRLETILVSSGSSPRPNVSCKSIVAHKSLAFFIVKLKPLSKRNEKVLQPSEPHLHSPLVATRSPRVRSPRAHAFVRIEIGRLVSRSAHSRDHACQRWSLFVGRPRLLGVERAST